MLNSFYRRLLPGTVRRITVQKIFASLKDEERGGATKKVPTTTSISN